MCYIATQTISADLARYNICALAGLSKLDPYEDLKLNHWVAMSTVIRPGPDPVHHSATQSSNEDGHVAFYSHDRAVLDSSWKGETGHRK